MKRCAKCHEEYPLNSFNIRKNGLPYSYCKPCHAIKCKDNNLKNRESILARKREHRLTNIEQYKLKDKLYALNNKEKREHSQKVTREKRRDNGKQALAAAKKRSHKLSATPKWHTEWEEFLMQEIYHIAKLRGMHVDHTIPLKGKLVCGLHTPTNLQLLTPVENMRKKNKYEVVSGGKDAT